MSKLQKRKFNVDGMPSIKELSSSKRKWTRNLCASIAIIIALFTTTYNMCGVFASASLASNSRLDSTFKTDPVKYDSPWGLKTLDELDSIKIDFKNILINQSEQYMRSIYPNTKMNANNLVTTCLEYSVDIPLCLSQGHLESHFGKRTGGTNSVFGLIGKKYRYTHPDSSVKDYASLISRKYVVKRTVDQVLNQNFTVEGSRNAKYAENPTYPATIRSIRNNIIRNTDIYNIQNQYYMLTNYLDSIRYYNNSVTVTDSI